MEFKGGAGERRKGFISLFDGWNLDIIIYFLG